MPLTDFPASGLTTGPLPRILRSTLTSPYGRKVRIAMEVLDLGNSIVLEPADTRQEDDSLRRQNPLGKMPCLLLDDGSAIFDSRVIIEYLDNLTGQRVLFPADTLERARMLTVATLADGITDAALLMVYEGRFREQHQISEIWLSHQRGKVERGLAAMQANLPDPGQTSIATISFACALGYLDWRQPVDWRMPFPSLVEWLEQFSDAEPAFAATAAPIEV